MERYLLNQHLQPEHRWSDVPCPAAYAEVLVCERFGKWPWELLDAPAEGYARLMRVLNLEGTIQQHVSKLPSDQPVFWEGE